MSRSILGKLLIVICFSLNSYSQVKFEQEKRIRIKNVPEQALQFISRLPFDKKIKWYKEISQDGITIEAKSCYNKHKYSIEFTEKGEIIDIEKKENFKNLNDSIKKKIRFELDTIFDKYFIKKTQYQYKSIKNNLTPIFEESDKTIALSSNYELIIRGKKEAVYKTYEITFNHKGNILKTLTVTQRSSDNIEF